MMWPVSRKVYPDPVFPDMLQSTIADVANTIAAFEPVILLADTSYHADIKRKARDDVILWDVPTDDLWARDAGPVFARLHGQQVISHIQFNGWGNKQTHAHDGLVAQRVADRLGMKMVPPGLVGEPGGMEWDGHGTMIAHRSFWLNDNRNPELTEADLTARLQAAFGADRVIWSDGVWDEDITDYHIDSLARFTGANHVLMNLPDAPDFGDPDTDATAKDAMTRHYPGCEIIMLNTDHLGEVGGGIHCATQQWPA